MSDYDITILTAARFLDPLHADWYTQQVLNEDRLLKEALERKGLKVFRTSWDDQHFDWAGTRYILFRTIWDYFDRYEEFVRWLDVANSKTKMINPYETIRWNMDKHYLNDLNTKGINTPPTLFIEPGNKSSLSKLVSESGWNDLILKPAVSGAGRHTYRLPPDEAVKYEADFRLLIRKESMLIQEFQHKVITEGEVAYILIAGKYSHAILKKAKPGDFRVQDDFGGTVHDYDPSKKEIEFAESVISVCDPVPVYARVDVLRDNHDKLCVSELELIEPELWFRRFPEAAIRLADRIIENFI